MNNRKFQFLANNYQCTTIDIKLISSKTEELMAKTVRCDSERASHLRNIIKWCRTAEVKTYLIRDEFTIIILPLRKTGERI